MEIRAIILLTILPLVYATGLPSPPRFLKQPPPNTIFFEEHSGELVVLECEASGEPAPRYTWLKNGNEIVWIFHDNFSKHPDKGTVIIFKATKDDVGQYQCFAENKWGTAASNTVFVQKRTLRGFNSTATKRLEAKEGEPFQLTCAEPPYGDPPPKMKWLLLSFDGTLQSATNSNRTVDKDGNLWFSSVTKLDETNEFLYVCYAYLEFGSSYKLGERIFLSVLKNDAPPKEPVFQYVSSKYTPALVGESIVLYCIYGGTPNPQTVWYKDGHILPPTAGGKAFSIQNVSLEDKGVYTCEVGNGIGTVKVHTIDLVVFAKPKLIDEPDFVTVGEGEPAEFRCTASGVPNPKITWFRNGKQTSPSTYHRIFIESVSKADIGNYGCNASNSFGYAYKDVYLNVLAIPPHFTEKPKNVMVVSGTNASLVCKIYGVPKPLVTWKREDVEVSGDRFHISPNGELRITNAQLEDSGSYQCFSENKFGKVRAEIDLLVRAPTKILNAPTDYQGIPDGLATFSCSVVHDATLDVEVIWLKNGTPVQFGEDNRLSKSVSLTISQLKSEDEGTYSCLAKTEFDQAEASAALTIQSNATIN